MLGKEFIIGLANYNVDKGNAVLEAVENTPRKKYYEDMGITLENVTSLESALKLSGLDYSVEKRPIQFVNYDKIKNFTWYEDSHGYIYRTTNQKPQHHYMHKELVPFEIVDHENRNRKDNRKSNLREATFSQNNQNSSISTRNTSGIIGVHFNVKRQKWIAEIGINKQVKYLGGFENKEEAIKTRLQAELEHFGEEFAP